MLLYKNRIIIASVAFISIAVIIFILFSNLSFTLKDNKLNNNEFIKTKAGLQIFDPLNNTNSTSINQNIKYEDLLNRKESKAFWTYYGSAIAQKAPIDHWIDSDGMHIGIKPAKKDTWAGLFAMTRDDYAMLFHVKITNNNTSIENDGRLSVGMYIQESIIYGNIDYVACVSDSDKDGIKWTIESGLGNKEIVTERHVLWESERSTNNPITMDCTIITNGDNLLKVYLDGVLKYSNDKLDLKMPRPFNSYLEIQSKNTDKMLYGQFNDYYTTMTDSIEFNNMPPNGVMKINIYQNSSSLKSLIGNNTVELSMPVGKDEANTIENIGKYQQPIYADIEFYNSSKILTVNQSELLSGGDIYSYR